MRALVPLSVKRVDRIRRRSTPSLVAFVAVLALLLGVAGATLPSGSAAATALPPALPQHFGIGVAAHPDSTGLTGWMPGTGVPFDYAYQYLSGGVNTNSGWETWNASGQFPLYYAQSAAQRGYVPVFPYYELAQSSGSCGSCGENQKDLSNLNNAATMASYYQNFTLLMQRLGTGTYGGIVGFGKTAVVHVEPDLSAYAQQAVLNTSANCFGYCTGQGNDPSLLKASVAASGVADVASYPNTYAGFNQALLHLRDLYAPNVLLAFHVSNWSTMQDVGSSTDSALNAASLGTQAGTFAALSGVTSAPTGTSTYDLIFNDVSDRDAGYKKYVFGQQNAFWDSLNVALPNFSRWEQYLSAADQAAGAKPIMVWQVPLGNQHFDTLNNTNGHYQDNRAEYFFSHVQELANVGVVAVLYGAGNGGSTVNNDGMNDAITNPASICTTDGLSSGSVCNTAVSTVSDDDGGYLRMAAQSYYSAPLQLGGGTTLPTPTPTSPAGTATPTSTTVPSTPTATAVPQPSFTTSATTSPASIAPGASETIAASVTSATATSVLVDVEVYDPSGAKVGQQFWDNQAFNAGQTLTYSMLWQAPANAALGTYTVKIGIFTPGWGTMYTWNDNAAQFSIAAAPTPTATLAPSPTPTVVSTATPTPTPKPHGKKH